MATKIDTPKLRHVLETQQFKEPDEVARLFELAREMEDLDNFDLSENDRPRIERLRLPNWPRERILVSLFYEPSTRTRFSFESAMISIGGRMLTTEEAEQFSSAVKGETLEDTIRVASRYGDVIVLRHRQEGSAEIASKYSRVPVINAGDGPGQHPTQALTDLYTIKKEKGSSNGLVVAMVGDLLYGRTVHSLTYLLAHMDSPELIFVAPEPLRMRPDILEYLREKGIPFRETDDLREAAAQANVLYVTRVQKERFPNPADYEAVRGVYVVDPEIVALMKSDALIMHPLPRVDELARGVDNDPKAAYFRQSDNGLYVRRALLKVVLDGFP